MRGRWGFKPRQLVICPSPNIRTWHVSLFSFPLVPPTHSHLPSPGSCPTWPCTMSPRLLSGRLGRTEGALCSHQLRSVESREFTMTKSPVCRAVLRRRVRATHSVDRGERDPMLPRAQHQEGSSRRKKKGWWWQVSEGAKCKGTGASHSSLCGPNPTPSTGAHRHPHL